MTTRVLMANKFALLKNESKKALLVIDVQENLLNPHSMLHMDPAAVFSFINRLNKTIEFFQAHKWPVLYTINEWTNPVLNLITGNVCKRGGKGTNIDNRVHVIDGNVYSKSKMNALSNKQISLFLKDHSISELYITGLFAEACVKHTARVALKNYYKAVLIEDAIGSSNLKKKLASLLYCERKGANIISTAELFHQVAAEAI